MLSTILEQFVDKSPLPVMAQSIMTRMFASESLDRLFENHAQCQFNQELLFSAQVDLMSLVVCGIYPSVNAAYRAKANALSVSTTALYQKLQGIELSVSQALVRETAQSLHQLCQQFSVPPSPRLPGYELRIIDGTCLAATDHRLNAIRQYAAKALPGKILAVLAPREQLVLDVFPCEDGHRQERALFPEVLAHVQPRQLWVGDRNFCTSEFLVKIDQTQAFFAIRQHKSLPWTAISELRPLGKTDTGQLFEQHVEVSFEDRVVPCRRVLLKLFQPTRDQEGEIAIVTNLPESDADAATVAALYQGRWTIETLFQTVTANFNGEIKTLAYPKAALFSYCMALVTYNILATIKAALSSVHGWGKIEAGLSDFYVVDEIQGVYRGMSIAVPQSDWQPFTTQPLSELAAFLEQLAAQVNLKRFRKTPRAAKKKRPPLIVHPKHRHVSTHRLLQAHQNSSK